MKRNNPGDFRKGLVPHNKSHGESWHGNRPSCTKEYKTWLGIKARCNNPNEDSYQRYGGRGIRVCDKWMHSYEQFLNDMGRAPSKDFSIERIDRDGNYEPSNCKWATDIEQANNKSINRIIEFKGKSMTVSQWARCLGIDAKLITKRMFRGWSFEKAVTKRKRCPLLIRLNGESKTVAEWAINTGISESLIRKRLRLGLSAKEVLGTKNTNNASRQRKIEFMGKSMSVTEWANDTGIKRSVLFKRIYNGWPIERVLTEGKGSAASTTILILTE